MTLIISLINTLLSVIILLVFIYSLLSYFLDSYHPIMRFLGRIIDPMLAPIRNRISQTGGWDLSPLILILLLYVFRAVLITLLRGIG